MEKLLCNKCKHEIERGISSDNQNVQDNSNYYRIKVEGFRKDGRQFHTKNYDLCQNCHNVFEKFINNICKNKSHIDYSKIRTAKKMASDKIYRSDRYIEPNEYQRVEDRIGIHAIGKNLFDQSYVIGNHMKPIPNTISIGNGLKEIKSVMKCGNVYVHNTKVFTKLEKFMWKKLFGVEIIPYENEKENV